MWWKRIDWRDVGKNVLVGAANAVGAIIVYGLAIYIVFRVVTKGKGRQGGREGGPPPTPSSALERAVAMRTGGLVDIGHGGGEAAGADAWW